MANYFGLTKTASFLSRHKALRAWYSAPLVKGLLTHLLNKPKEAARAKAYST
jgi:hypothetical protein